MNDTIEGWRELFRYDRWATERVLGVLERNRSSGMDLGAKSGPLVRAARLMAHLATAQRVWLSRIEGDGEEPTVLNTRGVPFTTRLDRILEHVVNHGTHHRAQALEAFRHLGIRRPVLDFIAFDREAESVRARAEGFPDAG